MVKPRDLHNWYLQAIKKLNPKSFNKNAQKPYNELTSEQKFIDEFIANKINMKIKSVREYLENNRDVIDGLDVRDLDEVILRLKKL